MPHQVYIISDRPVGSRVLVYKPPGLHPGDIRLFEVVEPPRGLRAIIGYGMNVIFFSVHGERPAVDEMANADLDGDKFWICDRKEILDTFKVSRPWEVPFADARSPRPIPAPDDPKAFEEKLAECCVEAHLRPDSTKGVAANAWLACMDKHTSANCEDANCEHLKKCIKLVDIYFAALDADKTGVKVRPVPEDCRERKQPHLKVPSKQNSGHSGNTQRKPPTGQPNDDDTYQKYRQKLYGGPNLVDAGKDRDVIKKEASAIYAAVYQRACSKEQPDWMKVDGCPLCLEGGRRCTFRAHPPPSSWYMTEKVAYEIYGPRKD